eukprot:NODE_1089_length_1112_cov_241.046096_g834_i0.p1 GENE.NODE_1089_length_1112_cov_241.046096_g834_i0~~NODE_1089_length_1112_cov_241.046096_g834_i0.p1  ORF type:complete len:312 (-),score=69.85 NODE_1089_length_1112_cov_241.046096_g834_i0:126-1061(-)
MDGEDVWNKQVKDAEDVLNNRSNQMGRLRVEFDLNMNKLNNKYLPKMSPFEAQVYQSEHEQYYIEKEIEWKLRLLETMNHLQGDFDEVQHMKTQREEEFAAIFPKFEDAMKSLEALTPEDTKVMQKYEHPPQLVYDTLEATHILKGQFEFSWEDAKVMMADAYFFGFFIKRAKNFDKDSVDEEILERLKKVATNSEFEPLSVAAVSTPCGALCKWVRSLYEYARIRLIVQPRGLSEGKLQEMIERLQEQLYLKKEEVSGAEQKLHALKTEFEEQRQELKNKYDQTMGPLQETFFEAHHNYGDICAAGAKNT